MNKARIILVTERFIEKKLEYGYLSNSRLSIPGGFLQVGTWHSYTTAEAKLDLLEKIKGL